MKPKYPEKIKEIIKEAPIHYCMAVLLDYKSKYKTANQLYEEWQKNKNYYETQKP